MAQCNQSQCDEFKFDEDEAIRLGWMVVGGEWFCMYHAPMASLGHRRELKQTAQRQMRNAHEAKRLLNADEYRAWDEFQSDLANFHRDSGRLAAKELRDMRPGEWVGQWRQLGRIDIAKSTESLDKIRADRQAARESLARGVR